MDNLFITPSSLELEKSASSAMEIRLSDPAAWEHEVTKAIYDTIPYIAKYNTIIQFQKKDEENGYGFGQIVVNNMISIPIIIYPKRNYSVLAPLDVFNYRNTWYPLTKEKIESILYNGQPFDRLAKPGEEVKPSYYGQNTNIRIPNEGRQILASDSSIIKTALDYMSDEDYKQLVREVSSHPYLKARFLNKIASRSKTTQKEAMRRNLPVNLIFIEKVGNKYDVEIVSDKVYDPEKTTMTKMAVRNNFGEKAINELNKTGFIAIETNRRYTKPVILNDSGSAARELNRSGSCILKLGAHKDIEGYLFNNVVDFDMNLVDMKIFSNGTKYAISNNFVGKPGIVKSAKLKSDKITGDSYGCFVSVDNKDNPIATIPFKIKTVLTKTADGIRAEIETIDGRNTSVTYTPYIETIMENPNGGYYIPSKMKFVKIGNKRIRPISTLDKFVKTAAIEKKSNKNITIRWSGSDYSIEGAGEIINQHDSNYLTKSSAKKILMKLGCCNEDSDAILDRVKVAKRLDVGGLKEINKNYEKPNEKLIKLARLIRKNTLKLAAMLPEGETVDEVLSLNMVTPDNVMVFRDYIPQLEDAQSHLAALLVAVRLGLQNIDEYSVKRSMDSLVETTKQLKDMFSVQNALDSMGIDNQEPESK